MQKRQLAKAAVAHRMQLLQRRLKNAFPHLDTLERRHLGVDDIDQQVMLRTVNASSMQGFVDSVIPRAIAEKDVEVEEEIPGEKGWLDELSIIMSKNKQMKQCIGMGFHETKLPSVILRNVIESAGWYTPYTPYQAEIAQGRLESLMNFQQMVIDLTGMGLANASLLDEATAVGEAIAMSVAHTKGKKRKVILDKRMHPASIAVATTRAQGFGIECLVQDVFESDLSDPEVGLVAVQYPDTHGDVHDFKALFATAKEHGVLSCCSADLLSLTMLTPPGELGADIACGTTQRFGVPLGFGGPHAAYFATQQSYARISPGRIIGVSKDADGQTVFRMALQTREQHIKREKATSNICTAQALLANVAAFYAVWHGPKGLRAIAEDINCKAKTLALGLEKAGFQLKSKNFFDTLWVDCSHLGADGGRVFTERCCAEGINIRQISDVEVGIALDECTEEHHLQAFFRAASLPAEGSDSMLELRTEAEKTSSIQHDLQRTSRFLDHPIFSKYHNETDMMRYIYRLERKDLGLNSAMIPLGSCTMKLNAASEMLPITWPSINSIHPYAPEDQVDGYKVLIKDLEDKLTALTGMDATCLQPNSGAQGEYAGLRVIKAYHESRGDFERDGCIVPSSAHGTNPASAIMCGMKLAVVKCLPDGSIDVVDLKKTIDEKLKGRVAAFMVTYPSTFGIFDENIKEITDMIHAAGGLVYVDGANFNAQMGLTLPGKYGGDVMHLNLHKTFSIPHGGGGPGMGPICVRSHLVPFLPSTASPGIKCGGDKPFGQVSQAPYGSAGVLPISWSYMRMMGWKGLKKSSAVALLNANYLMERLSSEYAILYKGDKGRCAHEFILDVRPFKKSAGIEVEDIAKRLIDYSFHAPTMSFPVPGTLMIEPTESESKTELDRFINALLSIRAEIRQIENGEMSATDNALKNAPHTMASIARTEWTHPYTREQAVYPVESLRSNKVWPTCRRIDSAYGDRNFICSCPPIETYL
eukprot:gene652-1000_t